MNRTFLLRQNRHEYLYRARNFRALKVFCYYAYITSIDIYVLKVALGPGSVVSHCIMGLFWGRILTQFPV